MGLNEPIQTNAFVHNIAFEFSKGSGEMNINDKNA